MMSQPGSMPAPRVSVIIPVYNSEKYLAQTLASVQAQTCGAWELIAIDDGSKDSSARIVRDFAGRDTRIRLVQQSNGGVAAARNRGYAESNPDAEFLIFLDNDDLWEPQTLQILVGALETAPAACAAHAQIRYIDDEGKPHAPEVIEREYSGLDSFLHNPRAIIDGELKYHTDERRTTFATFVVQNCIVSPGVTLLRRAALPPAPLFDPLTAPCDDWDLWIRLSRKADFVRLPNILLNYRLHATNASRNNESMGRAFDAVVTKLVGDSENTPEQAVAARLIYKRWVAERTKSRWIWVQENLAKRDLLIAAKQFRHYVRHRLGHL